MGGYRSTVGRVLITLALAVSAICCVAQRGRASPLDPIDRPATAFGAIVGPTEPVLGAQIRLDDDGSRTADASSGLTLRTDILGEPGQGGVIQEGPVDSLTPDAGSVGQGINMLMDQGDSSAHEDRHKATNARLALKLFARLLPSSFVGTANSEYTGSRGLPPRSNSPLGRDLSLSGYPSELLVDEILVPLANLLIAPDFDGSGRVSFSLLGLGEFDIDVSPNDVLPGGTSSSFMDLTWRGHGGYYLYTDAGAFRYARRDDKGAVRTMTLKEVILTMLYELIRLPVFYISIAGVILVLAFTSSKRA